MHDLLGRMTLEEKFWQLFMIPGSLDDPADDYRHGAYGLQISAADSAGGPAAIARAHAGRINRIQRYFVTRTRLRIPIIPFDEAVHGLIRPGATMFPQAIALAATWDTALVADVAEAIARESRSRGIRQALSPVLNIASDVRWGRVEETYGEDPFLAARMGEAVVGAFERQGVAATPKHFVANVGEGGRDSYPADYDRRVLEERFFPPFRGAVGAGAGSVMAAYNSVGGVPASQNRWLLTDVLRDDWGFRGVVISDQSATAGPTVLQHTEASTATAAAHALEAGLDVIFQSAYLQYRPYLATFQSGRISQPVIDSAVARVLRLKFQLGLFEHPYADPDSAAAWNGSPAHRDLALRAARESLVLLQNRGATLPLRKDLRRVAVIGTDAVEARLGDYSGAGVRPVSILQGIRDLLGPSADVGYAPGPGRADTSWVTVPAALRGAYFTNPGLEGRPAVVRTDRRVDFHWTITPPARGIPGDWYSVRWTGRVRVPAGDSVRHIGVEGDDGYRLYLDDSLLIDDWQKRSAGARLAPVSLAPRSSHTVRLEYFETTGNGRIRLVWDAGVTPHGDADLDSAAALAQRSDVAIVVAGIEEGEFHDRAALGLPGRQEEMIRRVAATGTPVVVVLIGGSAITMPWLDRVDAVLDAWYPGEAGGPAVAQVLFGDAAQAGRLPLTFPLAEGQLPLYYDHQPTGRGDDYGDLTGRPLFPFGFGLSYTTFGYSALAVSPDSLSGQGTVLVRCRVRNTGPVAGDEVVQLYVHQMLGSVARPVMQLAGFQRVHLEQGESRDVAFRLGPDQLQSFGPDGTWKVEPGEYRIMLGASSRDIRLRGLVRVP